MFYSDSEDSPPPGREYEALAFIIWLSAIIVMSILFSNLLVQFIELTSQIQTVITLSPVTSQVGLAVGEVNKALEDAEITIIKKRVRDFSCMKTKGLIPMTPP